MNDLYEEAIKWLEWMAGHQGHRMADDEVDDAALGASNLALRFRMCRNSPDFRYRAVLKRVIDGDTIVVDLDLGCKHWLHDEAIRLLDVDTWETRGEQREKGLAAKAFVEAELTRGDGVESVAVPELVIETELDKSGKFGRLLGRVHYQFMGTWYCLNDQLKGSEHEKVK